jgi:hypothetical protein
MPFFVSRGSSICFVEGLKDSTDFGGMYSTK